MILTPAQMRAEPVYIKPSGNEFMRSEIKERLANGETVFCINVGYKVFLQSGTLYTIYFSNAFMSPLDDSELEHCFTL